MLGDTSCRILLQLFGYLYPGYLCFKDIETRQDAKLKLWCMYWVLMAAFTAIQPIGDTFLFFLPFYYSAKLGFAVYLWYNNLAGAELVYTRYIHPFVTQHEPLVDSKIAEARSMASQLLSSNMARGVQWLQSLVVSALAQTHQAAASSLKAEPAGTAAPAAGYRRDDSFRSASSEMGPRTFSIKGE